MKKKYTSFFIFNLVFIFLTIVLISNSLAQEIEQSKVNKKPNSANSKNKSKPKFDPLNHPIDNDSIAKMKKRAEKGDASDYDAFKASQVKMSSKK